MIKNKFNIGQRVILVSNGAVKEMTVNGIFPSGSKSIKYTFAESSERMRISSVGYDPTRSPRAPRIERTASIWEREYMHIPMFMDHHATILYDDKTYFEESEIFENEQDFRANVKIEMIAPTTTELKEKLKSFDTGDKEINEIIKAVV